MVSPERELFTTVAELYDRVRPAYPDAVFEDIAWLTGQVAGARVLEIGCGTGQATLPLARMGYHVTAVELGAELAEVARRKLASFPGVDVVTSAFEGYSFAPGSFDMVVAATAFHWLDPAVRFERAASALSAGGSLVLIETRHVAGGDDDFFHESQACYARFMDATLADERLPDAGDVPSSAVEVAASGLFEEPVVRRYLWQATYTTEGYIDVLRTYSGHLALDEERRSGLFDCVRGLIDTRFGGCIRKQYMNELVVAGVRST